MIAHRKPTISRAMVVVIITLGLRRRQAAIARAQPELGLGDIANSLRQALVAVMELATDRACMP